MTLDELRRRVHVAFGPGMENATPDNVRAFLGEIARERWRSEKARLIAESPHRDRIQIPNEPAASYEEILRGFFAQLLTASAEEAAVELWLFALDMAYSDIEEQYRESLNRLFGGDSETEPADDHD
jgi:hypothetical protein